MLESLADITDGFATDQLTHCLQTATLAERAGADDEVVVAALCHDIGKAVSVPNHPAHRRRDPRPYVRDEVYKMIRVHQDFQGRHYYHHFGGDPTPASSTATSSPPSEFTLAEQFADEWDQIAFDPDYDTLPLEHFEPMVREVFAKPAHVLSHPPRVLWRGSGRGWLVDCASTNCFCSSGFAARSVSSLAPLRARHPAALALAAGARVARRPRRTSFAG